MAGQAADVLLPDDMRDLKMIHKERKNAEETQCSVTLFQVGIKVTGLQGVF